MAEDTPDDGAPQPAGDDELGAAVDDAMQYELKRQKARFLQRIMYMDRAEGVGRGEEIWEDPYPDERPE